MTVTNASADGFQFQKMIPKY